MIALDELVLLESHLGTRHIHVDYFRYLYNSFDFFAATQHNCVVSSILLQENSFSPLLPAGFFLPAHML
jgi:hypothetical protein